MPLCLLETCEVICINDKDVEIILMGKNKSLEFLCYYGYLEITKEAILHLIVTYANTSINVFNLN